MSYIMKGWKLDAGKEGTRIIFRDYQHEIVKRLIGIEGEKVITWSSKEMWEHLKSKGIKISRASVIFYMNFLVEDGLAFYLEEKGKGGIRKAYFIDRTWDDTRRHISIRLVEALGEGLDLDVDWVLAKWLG